MRATRVDGGLRRRGGRLLGAVAPALAVMLAAPAMLSAPVRAADPVATRDAAATVTALRFTRITGAGDVALNVVTTGDPAGTPIVFVHGIGQSYLAFEPQLHSSLATRHRLVAFDLRGHGNSGKPETPEAYDDTRKWADDLQAVLRATTTCPAVLVGWSYGTGVIADYLRHHGTGRVAGIVLVAAEGGLSLDGPRPPGTGPIAAMLDAMHQRQEGLDLDANITAARELARMLTQQPMPEDWVERAALVSMRVPAPVWGYLRRHPSSNGELRARIDKPVLLVIGRHDGGVSEERARRLAATLGNATVRVFEQSGHTPFVEEATAFNEALGAFATANAPRRDACR